MRLRDVEVPASPIGRGCVIVAYGWVGPILPEKCTRPSVEGLTSISLYFFVLVLCKMFQVIPQCSRWTFAQNKKFCRQNVFWGPGWLW
jgi:hypothetical protein